MLIATRPCTRPKAAAAAGRAAAAPRRPPASAGPSAGPAFVPFQLADEMYANIFRSPTKFGYPLCDGSTFEPKFGYIFVESRLPGSGAKKPKVEADADGVQWQQASTANATAKLLADGQTEFVRNYSARRSKGSCASRPQVRPFIVYQRQQYDAVKAENPGSSSGEVKAIIGQEWRSMSDEQKRPFKEEAQRINQQTKQQVGAVDPQELLA